MILVILGAGASYDSVPSKPPSITTYDRTRLPNRPPLANELFADTPIVNDTLALFPECHPIVPYLQNLPQGSTIESVLEGLQAESEADLFRKRQLVAVRCLKGLLPQTRTILSIGWRGMETHFLKMLAESLAEKNSDRHLCCCRQFHCRQGCTCSISKCWNINNRKSLR